MEACERLPKKRPPKIFGKNTMDLQWKMRTNYNARPCEDKRKAPDARTMENNGKQWKTMEKTMRRTMETIGNPETC
jgi:hypothetical protein